MSKIKGSSKHLPKIKIPVAATEESKLVKLVKWRKLDPKELEMENRKFGRIPTLYRQKQQPTSVASVVDFGEGAAASEAVVVDTQSKPRTNKYAGIIFGLLAAASFATSSLTTKLLAEKKYHTFNIALWKYQGMTIFGPILLYYFTSVRKLPILKDVWPITKSKIRIIFFLMLRGTVGVCTLCLQTQALKYLTLADSSLITFSTPIAVTFLARIFLSEPCGIVSFIIALTTFLGVGILSRPPILTGEEGFDLNLLIGISYAFTAMLFLSSVFIIIRLIKETHFSLFICFYGYLASIETGTLAYSFGVLQLPQSGMDYLFAGGGAILSLFGQFFLIMALKADLAGLVSLVRTGDVVFAFIWQIILLGSIPDLFSYIGAIIIISCIVITGFNKWLESLPIHHKIRIKFSFLLK